MRDGHFIKNRAQCVGAEHISLDTHDFVQTYNGSANFPGQNIGMVPVNIRNTNEPEHPGTTIVATLSEQEEKGTDIAGVAGKNQFSMVCIEKTLMNKEIGFTYRVLDIFRRANLSVEHIPSSIDGINVIVDQPSFQDKEEEVIEEIRAQLHPDNIRVVPQLALIAVVGEGMKHAIGVAARVFVALARAQVNVQVINQGASEVNIIVGVAPDEFHAAVNELYKEFVGTQRVSVSPV